MFYFESFPKDIHLDGVQMTNILRRFSLSPELEYNENLFDLYEMVQGETLESIAEQFYGNSEYSWVLLLANKELNPFYANYKTEEEMTRYIKNKYGVRLYEPHHYETTGGLPVDEVDVHNYINNKFSLSNKDIVPIPNDKYERVINENRRFIRIIKPGYLQQIEKEIVLGLTKQPIDESQFT